jgi:hypothetical protein
LFHDGVVAVLGFGLEHHERGVGEHRVIAPGGEQFALAFAGFVVEVFDPADDQPGGDGLPLPGGERGVSGLGDLDVRDPAAQLVIPDGRGYLMGFQASSPIAAIAALTCGFICTVTEKNAPARRTAPVNAAE